MGIASGSQISSTLKQHPQMRLGTEVSLASCSFTVMSACPNPLPPSHLTLQPYLQHTTPFSAPFTPSTISSVPHQSAVIQATDREKRGRETDRDPFTTNVLPCLLFSFPSSLHLPNEISTVLSNTLYPFFPLHV